MSTDVLRTVDGWWVRRGSSATPIRTDRQEQPA